MEGRVCATLIGAVFVVGCSRSGGKTEIVRAAPAFVAPISESRPTGCRAPLGLDVVPIGESRSGSTVVLARTHGRLLAYVADEDASVVRILDVEAATELGSVPMPGHPGRMLMLRGGRLAVTLRDAAKVAVYTPSPAAETGLDPLCSFDTPDEPVDLAASPDGNTLMALCDWSHTLTAFDVDTGASKYAVDLPRSPRAVLVAADGAHAYIAHAAGSSMSSVDLRASVPVAQDVLQISGHICQGFALAETREPSPHVIAPIVLVETGNVEVQSSGYGAAEGSPPEAPAAVILDESSGKRVFRGPSVDNEVSPCLLPRAAATSRSALYVACMGIDQVIEYNASPNETEFELRRWPVPSGPTGLALHGSLAVVWSQFAGEATILSLAKDGQSSPIRVPVAHLPRKEDDTTLALGRALFHSSSDFRISRDGRACASCHPDGRDDGLVWSAPGGPRQTPMLAGRLPLTAPYGWDGAARDVTHHLAHTFARLGGQGLAPHELDALERYITTLEGPPVHASARESQIVRGREVFFSAGCGSCHTADGAWTDTHGHKVGSRAPADTIATFDTPSLRFVAGTAPYFHDGRYPTLLALLSSKDSPMGAARNRPPEELEALEAFVKSL